MSLKLHFLDSHLDYLPENLGDYNEEHREGDAIKTLKKWGAVIKANAT